MEFKAITLKKEERIATITLNNPPHNPLGLATIDRLEELFTQLGSDESVRAVMKALDVELVSVPDLMAAVRAVDCVVIITNHSDYDYAAILDAAKLIVDTRNALGKLGKDNPKVVRL